MQHHHQPHHQEQPHPNNNTEDFFKPILKFFNSLPPVTRTWFALSLITTGLHTLDVFETSKLIFDWDRFISNLELWRILTSFTWAGPGTMIDFPVLMLLYSMVVIVPDYENDPHDCSSTPYDQYNNNDDDDNPNDIRDRIVNQWTTTTQQRRRRHRKSDCIFSFLSCAILILVSYFIIIETSIFDTYITTLTIPRPILLPVFTRTLLYSIITLHSLKHPDQPQNINFFTVPGRYVPLFHVAFGLLMGYRVNETIHGIAVGLIYAYLVKEDSWCSLAINRKRLICAPFILIHFVGEDGDMIATEQIFDRAANNENNPYHGIQLEPGANYLHHAATIGDVSFIQSQIDTVELVSSPADIMRAAAPFRQQDRNGWQPMHECCRSGQTNVLKLLLEIDIVTNESSISWRRRAGKLKVDVNARTNNGRGFTALRIVEENHGDDHECAQLLREVGGVSLGFGDNTEDEE